MDAALHFQAFRGVGIYPSEDPPYAPEIFETASDELGELLDLIPEQSPTPSLVVQADATPGSTEEHSTASEHRPESERPLNTSGEVVGINTQKPFLSGDGRPLQGIGFALSASDLVTILRRFYPNFSPVLQAKPTAETNQGKGKVMISADVEGAEIYVDGDFVGSVPSTFTLSVGTHKVKVRTLKGATWQRDVHVLDGSEVNLKATLIKDEKPK